MGCWNGTCMISNLPIQQGEKIKLVLLRNGISSKNLFNSSGYVYSHDIFTPSFFPLTGVYNDYGMIEVVDEDWNHKLIEDHFKKLFGEKIIVNGETKENWNLIDVLNGVERNDLKYYGKPNKEQLERKAMAIEAVKVYDKQGYSSKKIEREWQELAEMNVDEMLRQANLSFVMIKEDVWNHICENYVGEFYNRDSKSNTDNDNDFYLSAKKYCKIEFENGIIRIEKFSKLINTTTNTTEEVLKAHEKLNEFLASGYAMAVFTKQNLDFLTPELYDKFTIEGDAERREDVLNRYTEFTIISSFLSETRKGWMMQPGSGSQHDGWGVHLMLAEIVMKICKAGIKESE